MKLRYLAVPLALSVPVALSLIKPAYAIPTDATLYIHIKHAPPYPYTLGNVRGIYQQILAANRTGLNIGLEPQCSADWATTLSYLSECGDIPTMLNVCTSDDNLQLTPQQVEEALAVCNVKWLRFHEVSDTMTPDYVQSILQLSRQTGIPIFWNEWNTNTYPNIANSIVGYEDIVSVSFGTNSEQYEPADGFQLLANTFQRYSASVQSWYWWERNGRVDGYENLMPVDLMRLHTQQAFLAGCEVVQFEPFSYFFDQTTPKYTLAGVMANPF